MTDALHFSVNTGASEPIYRQLVAGQEIPSVREQAQLRAVHPMTISKAYSLLEVGGCWRACRCCYGSPPWRGRGWRWR
ncbi:hypothetical protein [Roseateles sp. DAIF2]|uniref:hypothetical protein n=1 Tax=Roseateles sp. DAIF2 TaxID=2714952 RepID=UPI0018A25100|nr:hypothetical protein [Roseateles sp. DAIF2]